MTDQQDRKPVSAADELRAEIEGLVARIRQALDANRGNTAFRPVMLLGGAEKASQELSYLHGHVTALLQKQDVEAAIKQRRRLQRLAGMAAPRRY
ncbi:hypothetical protein [Streptomyces sp. NPDC049915]|uniref:hypothetical protein n=1 Tax=Streptomyces sp. NPDC049915 TaxID=3155510 RepID=UPI00342A2687